MRAVRWHGRDDVQLDDVPIPSFTDDQVLIRVEGAGVCGTDIEEVRAGPINVPIEPHPVSGLTAPITLGHETVGVVVEAGARSGVEVGRRVAPWNMNPCRVCADCRGGHANRCPHSSALGMSEDGGMADYLVALGQSCATIGEDVAIERAVLTEPYAVALHAIHQVDVTRGRVAVVGIGSLGLCVVEAALLAGAADVVVLSRSERSRQAGRDAGAHAAVPLEQAGEVGADIVFETAGADAAIAASLAAAIRGAQIVVLGGHTRPVLTDLFDVTVRELRLLGSVGHCLDRDFHAAAARITAGDLARVHRPIDIVPLEAGPQALRDSGSTIKHVLVPTGIA